MTITLYHNPKCGTSRNALALIRAAGHEPVIVEYLKTGWTMALLKDLLAKSGLSARQILRVKGTPAAELGLTDPAVSDDRILAAMVAHPVLVERPIVASPKGVRLGRPVDAIRDIL
jgi:arsenate reductase (glutaredoxin)